MTIEEENKALKQLLEWAEECGFGLDELLNWDYEDFDYDRFKKETAEMDYLDSMIYYADWWLHNHENEN